MAVPASRGGWLWLRVLLLGGWDMGPFSFICAAICGLFGVGGITTLGGVCVVSFSSYSSGCTP